MKRRTLNQIFGTEGETSLAETIVDYFWRDYNITEVPVASTSPSLVASIQEGWQELVDNGSVKLFDIGTPHFLRVIPADVERKLPEYLNTLVRENYLRQTKVGYIIQL